jgi:hypothetical protein
MADNTPVATASATILNLMDWVQRLNTQTLRTFAARAAPRRQGR